MQYKSLNVVKIDVRLCHGRGSYNSVGEKDKLCSKGWGSDFFSRVGQWHAPNTLPSQPTHTHSLITPCGENLKMEPCLVFFPFHYKASVLFDFGSLAWDIFPVYFFPLISTCMSFDPNNAFHFGKGFFLPNLATIGHSWAFWPLAEPYPVTNALNFSQGFFIPNLLPQGIPKYLTGLTLDDPYKTFDHSTTLHFSQGFFLSNLVAIRHFQSRLAYGWSSTFGWVTLKSWSQTLGNHALPP